MRKSLGSDDLSRQTQVEFAVVVEVGELLAAKEQRCSTGNWRRLSGQSVDGDQKFKRLFLGSAHAAGRTGVRGVRYGAGPRHTPGYALTRTLKPPKIMRLPSNGIRSTS